MHSGLANLFNVAPKKSTHFSVTMNNKNRNKSHKML